jgi:hypothetical protein
VPDKRGPPKIGSGSARVRIPSCCAIVSASRRSCLPRARSSRADAAFGAIKSRAYATRAGWVLSQAHLGEQRVVAIEIIAESI